MNNQYLEMVQNDYGFNWNFTLEDAQGNIQNLASSNLVFSCQLESDPTVNFENAMTVLSAPNGTCYYTVQETDFTVPGTYIAQIVIDYTAGSTVSFSGITINVLPKIPNS